MRKLLGILSVTSLFCFSWNMICLAQTQTETPEQGEVVQVRVESNPVVYSWLDLTSKSESGEATKPLTFYVGSAEFEVEIQASPSQCEGDKECCDCCQASSCDKTKSTEQVQIGVPIVQGHKLFTNIGSSPQQECEAKESCCSSQESCCQNTKNSGATKSACSTGECSNEVVLGVPFLANLPRISSSFEVTGVDVPSTCPQCPHPVKKVENPQACGYRVHVGLASNGNWEERTCEGEACGQNACQNNICIVETSPVQSAACPVASGATAQIIASVPTQSYMFVPNVDCELPASNSDCDCTDCQCGSCQCGSRHFGPRMSSAAATCPVVGSAWVAQGDCTSGCPFAGKCPSPNVASPDFAMASRIGTYHPHWSTTPPLPPFPHPVMPAPQMAAQPHQRMIDAETVELLVENARLETRLEAVSQLFDQKRELVDAQIELARQEVVVEFQQEMLEMVEVLAEVHAGQAVAEAVAGQLEQQLAATQQQKSQSTEAEIAELKQMLQKVVAENRLLRESLNQAQLRQADLNSEANRK